MIRNLILISIFLLSSLSGISQSSISLTYPNVEDQDMVMIMELMNIKSLDAKFKGNLKGKEIRH